MYPEFYINSNSLNIYVAVKIFIFFSEANALRFTEAQREIFISFLHVALRTGGHWIQQQHSINGISTVYEVKKFNLQYNVVVFSRETPGTWDV